MTLQSLLPGLACPRCATQLAPAMRACPGCGALLFAERLRTLADGAREAEGVGDAASALRAWREALELLPPDSKQHQAIRARIVELGRAPNAGGGSGGGAAAAVPHGRGNSKSPLGKAAGGLGAAGLLLWKLKAAALLFLTKFKFLLWGLTKASTLLSMLLSLGVYWSLWGWKFALGLVLSIYVHEMGHVVALRRYGFRAGAPMFIPGLGAVIRLQQNVVDPREDAVIGLAGPIYGLGAALASLGLWYATRQPIFAAVAGVGAWVNLFNLLPIATLDGGRAFHAMSRTQKWLAAATALGAWYGTGDGLLVLLGIVCAGRALVDKQAGDRGDWKAAAQFGGLVVALSLLATVRGAVGR